MSEIALKNDSGKIDWSLLPIEAMEEMLKVFMFGEQKYARFNFRNGFNSNRLIAAAMRHIAAWQKGEDTDPETGLSHLAHGLCCLSMLLTNKIENKMEDGRYKYAGT